MKKESQFIELSQNIALLSVPRNRPFLGTLIPRIKEAIKSAGKTVRHSLNLDIELLMHRDDYDYTSIVIGGRQEVELTDRDSAEEQCNDPSRIIDFRELDMTQDPDLSVITAILSAPPQRVPQIHGYTCSINPDGTLQVGCETVGLEVLDWVHEHSQAARATYVPPKPVKADKPKRVRRARRPTGIS